MPIFDYRCEECTAEFETLIRNSRDQEELVCPTCGSKELAKKISMPARPLAISNPAGNACGEGPPCGASWCGRKG